MITASSRLPAAFLPHCSFLSHSNDSNNPRPTQTSMLAPSKVACFDTTVTLLVSMASLSPLLSSPTCLMTRDGVTVTFNNSNGLLSLAKKGHLTKGRMVHITGHISGVTEVYEKDGVTQLLKRPRLIAGLQHCHSWCWVLCLSKTHLRVLLTVQL